MFSMPGASALSQFRLAKLLASLKVIDSRVDAVTARYIHFVDVSGPLAQSEHRLLGKLLTYGPAGSPVGGSCQRVVVVPRFGTVSAWSTKATDIAHVCGLARIRRLERGTEFSLSASAELSGAALQRLGTHLHDRMTESICVGADVELVELFKAGPARPLRRVPLGHDGHAALGQANADWGLALSSEEIDFLVSTFRALKRDPTDAELMMFAQANSEHCRHKIFNARFIVDGTPMSDSLFDMIRATHARNPTGVLSAYRDNAAVIEGATGVRFFPNALTQRYGPVVEPIDILMKVETHNHPTAISPYPGAATGAGGEIRDEGATGIGAKPKAGLTGFTVSNLKIPGMRQPWEQDFGKPDRIASALDIMLAAPLGSASFNNEFGRPNVCGYFRTFEQDAAHLRPGLIYGYHKPIMIAGGLGNVRRRDVHKREVVVGAPLVVLGGPAMLIGLGGGAASSLNSGQSSRELDFASVQRGNAEMQRRAQEVIDRCWAMGDANPILLIHDVGAGGLSNALPEAIAHSRRGGRIDLRTIPSAEPQLSPMELWCNEAQERYVLALRPGSTAAFGALCERERCPWAVVGEVTGDQRLRVDDPLLGDVPVDMPLESVLGNAPRQIRTVHSVKRPMAPLDRSGVTFAESLERLLALPTVAAKSFLITIGDRSVGGLISRDQMVGPWQVPVADVAVTSSDYEGYSGEAMAMGERSPVALLDAPASGRLAVGEAITNLLAADVRALADVRLSANWMAACGAPGADAELYATVRAVGAELCTALGIAIPVGKDSLSMRTAWSIDGDERTVLAPVSVVISAFAPVGDVRGTLTPELKLDPPSRLLLIDLGDGLDRLGGSCWAQVFGRTGGRPADLEDPALLRRFFAAIRELKRRRLLLAYHDRSDGGALVTLLEMAFAAHCGLEIDLGDVSDPIAACFSEELGAVVQVATDQVAEALRVLEEHGLGALTRDVGRPAAAGGPGGGLIAIRAQGSELYSAQRIALQRRWSEVSFRLQEMRDHPECAREEFAALLDGADPGLHARLGFDPSADVAAPFIATGARPAIAVLREQGVNSQTEMAAAFTRAGFDAYDVHMSDILAGRSRLGRFHALVACGGFSYGDVLGAGEGWAKSILFNDRARQEFAAFFARQSTLTLGVCNGCQMLAALKELIPGAERWPRFVRNRSEQYEARLCLVQVPASRSALFAGMHGSVLPITVAHGEGLAEFEHHGAAAELLEHGLMTLRFVDHREAPAERYPFNPNGSPLGLAGLCTVDGRVTALMPHPERVFRTVQHSWAPADWREDGGWMRLFRNARVALG